VLRSDVLLKRHILVVKCLSLQATDEAGVLDDLFFVGFLCSEISEGIDDDTKDEVEDDDDDHEEEEHVVDESKSVERFSAGGWSQHISYSSSVPQSLVQSGDDLFSVPMFPMILTR